MFSDTFRKDGIICVVSFQDGLLRSPSYSVLFCGYFPILGRLGWTCNFSYIRQSVVA